MKKRTTILLIILGLVLTIQLPFFTPPKNAGLATGKTAITDKYDVPPNVQMVLYNSCYDCHSNHTRQYPWYYHVQPVSWWMNQHIRRGKSFLNFSEFGAYPTNKVIKKFDEISVVMRKHSMPLASYQWLHPEARLTNKQYSEVVAWAETMKARLKKEVGHLPDAE